MPRTSVRGFFFAVAWKHLIPFAMDITSFLLLPLLIFVARVADVTVATVKLMYVVNNARRIAALLGFVEALITIMALSRIMHEASHWSAFVAFAAGFSTGTYVGMSIEAKLAYGSCMVRWFSKKLPADLLIELQQNHFRYSLVDADSHEGNIRVLHTVCKRKRLPELLALVERHLPNAQYTIEGTQRVSPALADAPLPVGSVDSRASPASRWRVLPVAPAGS